MANIAMKMSLYVSPLYSRMGETTNTAISRPGWSLSLTMALKKANMLNSGATSYRALSRV